VYGDKKWPDTGEIDIMEQVGFDPYKIHASVHTKAHNHRANSHPVNHVIVNDAVTNFKIYTLDWEPHRLSMYVGDESNPLQTRILFWDKQGDWTKW
jgi:beta-glucanase (GH16 family)